MGWFDDIGDSISGLASSAGGILPGLVGTALTGFALKKVTDSIAKTNEEAQANLSALKKDAGQAIQIPPASDNKIPVLYGEATFGGIITEAVMSADNKTMTYVVTLSEYTGTLLSTGGPSYFTFKSLYWGDNRMVFGADGVTAQYTVDRNGNIDRNIKDLVKVYCYAGNSGGHVAPEGYTVSGTNAWDVVPNWGTSHVMSDLIFLVIQVTYNRDKGITGIQNVKVNLQNSMSLPGDCIWDYMTNTRYGAAIPAEDIYDE